MSLLVAFAAVTAGAALAGVLLRRDHPFGRPLLVLALVVFGGSLVWVAGGSEASELAELLAAAGVALVIASAYGSLGWWLAAPHRHVAVRGGGIALGVIAAIPIAFGLILALWVLACSGQAC